MDAHPHCWPGNGGDQYLKEYVKGAPPVSRGESTAFHSPVSGDAMVRNGGLVEWAAGICESGAHHFRWSGPRGTTRFVVRLRGSYIGGTCKMLSRCILVSSQILSYLKSYRKMQ